MNDKKEKMGTIVYKESVRKFIPFGQVVFRIEMHLLSLFLQRTVSFFHSVSFTITCRSSSLCPGVQGYGFLGFVVSNVCMVVIIFILSFHSHILFSTLLTLSKK